MPLFVSVMLLLGMLTVPIPVCGFSSEEISTSYCDEVDISLKIQQNRLEVEVPQSGQFAYLIVTFMNSDGGVPDTAQPVQVINGAAVYDFSDKEDGIYYVQLYRSSSEQGTFDGIIGGMESVAVKIENGSGKIIPSSVYDENLTKYLQQAVSADALCYYLKPSVNVQSDNGKIVSKAAEITDGISDPYQKVRSVHDWVASNLYFDYDALSQQGQNWPKDALGSSRDRKNRMRRLCESDDSFVEGLRYTGEDDDRLCTLRFRAFVERIKSEGEPGESRLDCRFCRRQVDIDGSHLGFSELLQGRRISHVGRSAHLFRQYIGILFLQSSAVTE